MYFNYIPCCSLRMTLSTLPGSKLWREIHCTIFPKPVCSKTKLCHTRVGTVYFTLQNNLVLHGLHSHCCSIKKQKPVSYSAVWKTYWSAPKRSRWSEKILCASTTNGGWKEASPISLMITPLLVTILTLERFRPLGSSKIGSAILLSAPT